MAGFASAMTDEEIGAAAKYFFMDASNTLDTKSWKVTDRSTKTRRAPRGCSLRSRAPMRVPKPRRVNACIINSGERRHETDIRRNPRHGLRRAMCLRAASDKTGQALVENGVTASGGKATACTACHWTSTCGVWDPCQNPLAVHQAISRANSMTCSTEPVGT